MLIDRNENIQLNLVFLFDLITLSFREIINAISHGKRRK